MGARETRGRGHGQGRQTRQIAGARGVLLPVSAADAQTDQQIQETKRSLIGQRALVSYREGGAVYGTYYFLDIHLCRSGQYLLFGQSRKQTVLNNHQVNNWRDAGKWDVLARQGQVGLLYVSTAGAREFVPLRLQPDGSIRANEGVSVSPKGAAQCR